MLHKAMAIAALENPTNQDRPYPSACHSLVDQSPLDPMFPSPILVPEKYINLNIIVNFICNFLNYITYSN